MYYFDVYYNFKHGFNIHKNIAQNISCWTDTSVTFNYLLCLFFHIIYTVA